MFCFFCSGVVEDGVYLFVYGCCVVDMVQVEMG